MQLRLMLGGALGSGGRLGVSEGPPAVAQDPPPPLSYGVANVAWSGEFASGQPVSNLRGVVSALAYAYDSHGIGHRTGARGRHLQIPLPPYEHLRPYIPPTSPHPISTVRHPHYYHSAPAPTTYPLLAPHIGYPHRSARISRLEQDKLFLATQRP